MQLLETETIFSPIGPPIAPLPSPVKVYNQDSDPASSVREEPSVVAEPSRPRPSTVTVIHTGTKWRQVPREVSWETTELWDGMKPSKASWVDVVAQFAYPATSHLFLPTTGGIWGALSQLHLPWLSTAPPPPPAAPLPTVIQTWKYRGEDAHQKLLWKPCSAWILVVWQINKQLVWKVPH